MMNECEEIAKKVIENSDLALWQAYCEKKEELEELEEKFRMACWLLRDAADTLACMDDANYPLISIMQFLEENN
jgi:hypothetical protein